MSGATDDMECAGWVLVADDAAAGRGLLSGLLEQLGYAATAVEGGGAAVRALEQAPARFGLVLMDIDMPGMDGLAAAQAIAALGEPPPLVGLIAAGRPAEAERAAAAGMASSLRKPVRREELCATLDQLFRDPAQAPPPIDLAHLDRYTAGDAALERELLDLFRDNAEAYLAQLATANDDEAWHRAAHTLKGAARGIGAGRIAELAQAAEGLTGARGDAAGRARALKRLRAATAVLRRAIHPSRLQVWRARAADNARP